MVLVLSGCAVLTPANEEAPECATSEDCPCGHHCERDGEGRRRCAPGCETETDCDGYSGARRCGLSFKICWRHPPGGAVGRCIERCYSNRYCGPEGTCMTTSEVCCNDRPCDTLDHECRSNACVKSSARSGRTVDGR